MPPSLSPVARAIWIIDEAEAIKDAETFRKALASVFPTLTVEGVKDAIEECQAVHKAEKEELDRQIAATHEDMAEMQEIALETGIALTPHTVIGEFIASAIALGNERAMRLSTKIEGTTITYREPD